MATALVVTDMLNTYEHDDGELLAENVRATLPALADLLDHAKSDDEARRLRQRQPR